MKRTVDPAGIWYHGSNQRFEVLRAGSTITQWRALAEAFSHRPSRLEYGDDGEIVHNGREDGVLYAVDEPVVAGVDAVPHPNSSMEENVEFIALRPLRVRLVQTLDLERPDAGREGAQNGRGTRTRIPRR